MKDRLYQCALLPFALVIVVIAMAYHYVDYLLALAFGRREKYGVRWNGWIWRGPSNGDPDWPHLRR